MPCDEAPAGPAEDPTTAVAALAAALSALELDGLSPDRAAALLVLAAEIERLGAGLRLLVTGRAVSGDGWRDQGHRSPAGWVAGIAGTSVADARAAIDTSERLAELTETRDLVRAGALSGAQVMAVTAAAWADPSRELDLLEAAGALTLDSLRVLCRQVRIEAPAPDERCDRTPRPRSLRFWTDPDGLVRLSGALAAGPGAQLVSAVRSRAAFVADEAMAAGLEPEPQDAYDADALVALVTGDRRMATFTGNVGVGAGPSAGSGERHAGASIALHVDLTALRRGSLQGDERCEIPGLGPVPLATVERVAGDATSSLVVRHGAEVLRVIELGPTVPEPVATELDARHRTCVVPRCSVSLSLQTVFWPVPWCQGGPAALDNLVRLCPFHHRLMIEEGYRLSPRGGGWEWRGPP